MLAIVRASLRMFVVGFVVGTLLAPRAGAETRKLLAEKFTVIANQILELAALPPIDAGRADRNGGDVPPRHPERRTGARPEA